MREAAAAPPPPSRAEVAAAAGRTVDDVVAPGLRLLLVGINPGLYTAAAGHHFARPGNRFWPALHLSGLTDRLLAPWEERELLRRGIGITNVVPRATATAAELSRAELRGGAAALERRVTALRPAVVAVLGVQAYRLGFERPRAGLGEQPERLGGAAVWVLANPSGAQARYQMADLVDQLRRVGEAAGLLRPATA